MSVGLLNNYKQVVRTIGETAPAPAPVTPEVPAAPAPAPRDSFQINLGKKLISKDEFALRYPTTWVQNLYQKRLERKANKKELQQARKKIAPVIARHGSLEQARKAIAEGLKKTHEYKLVHQDAWVRGIIKKHLNRKATRKDQQRAEQVIDRVIRKDGTLKDGKQAVTKAVKKTAEYKRKHPKINRKRSEIFLAQPNGWTCGPTSLTMALKAVGLRPNNHTTMNEMVRRTGTSPNGGVPGNASLLGNAAKAVGAQARFSPSASPGEVRAALKKGHGVVLNGSLGTGGHFIYVAGIAKDGRFIICDPARPTLTRMTDAELNHFANTYSNPRGFAEIWR
jgi:Peptidase_C39 like family